MDILGLVAKLCPTLCDPMVCSPPGFSVNGFPTQEYWSGLPFPSPGDLFDPGIEPVSPTLQADSLPAEPLRKPVVISHWIKKKFPPNDIQYRKSRE